MSIERAARAIAFPTPAAHLDGYLALPGGDGPHPGVVVIHEAFGLNDNIRRLCAVVGSYPGKDFTARSGRKLDIQLAKAGVVCDIKVYPDARHSFFNDQRRAYDAPAAADASQRTLDFFSEHVRSPRSPA